MRINPASDPLISYGNCFRFGSAFVTLELNLIVGRLQALAGE
jgi:hypothetical protein